MAVHTGHTHTARMEVPVCGWLRGGIVLGLAWGWVLRGKGEVEGGVGGGVGG